jgi:hypothetical protein
MPPSWGDDPDDWWWEQEAKELGHTALSGVRDTATKWGATISGFLGVFGTVAFIKGPDAFKDVHADWAAAFAASLVIAATVFASAAVLLAALAAQGVPRAVNQLDGWALKSYHKTQARRARLYLAWSRGLAVAAAMAVITGLSVTWFVVLGERKTNTAEKPKGQPMIVVRSGRPQCGTLTVAKDGSLLFAVGDKPALPLGNVNASDLIPVGSCPAS